MVINYRGFRPSHRSVSIPPPRSLQPFWIALQACLTPYVTDAGFPSLPIHFLQRLAPFFVQTRQRLPPFPSNEYLPNFSPLLFLSPFIRTSFRRGRFPCRPAVSEGQIFPIFLPLYTSFPPSCIHLLSATPTRFRFFRSCDFFFVFFLLDAP